MATNRTQAERGKFLNADTWDKLTSNIEKGFNEFRGNSDNKLIQILAKYQESKLGQAHTKAGKATADILFKNPYEFGQQMTNDVSDIFGMNNPNYQMRNAPGTGWGNVGKQAGRALSTGSFIAGTGNPLGAAVYTGISGGVGYLGNRIAGQSHKSAMSNVLPNMLESVPRGFQIAGISSLTNPWIDKAGLAGKGYWGRNLIKSPLNVVQGLAMDQATGMPTTKESVAIDALFPFAQEAAGAAVKNAKEAIEYRNTLSPLERQRGFIKPGEFLPKNSDDLLEEARKYESAEEFVKSKGYNIVFVDNKDYQGKINPDTKRLYISQLDKLGNKLPQEELNKRVAHEIGHLTDFTGGGVQLTNKTELSKILNERYGGSAGNADIKISIPFSEAEGSAYAKGLFLTNPNKLKKIAPETYSQLSKGMGIEIGGLKDQANKVVGVEINPKLVSRTADRQKFKAPIIVDGKEAGKMTYSVTDTKGGNQSLFVDYIESNEPGKGVGTNAMKKVVDKYPRVKEIYLEASPEASGFWKKLGATETKIPASDESAKVFYLDPNKLKAPWKPLTDNTDNYYYHGTPTKNIKSIQQGGLKVGNSGAVALTKEGEESALSWAKTLYKGQDVTSVRVSKDAVNNKFLEDVDAIYSKDDIPPEMLEIKVNGKWKPLVENKEIVRDVNMDKAQEWLNRPTKELNSMTKSTMSYPYKDLKRYSSEELIELVKKGKVKYDNQSNLLKSMDDRSVIGRLPKTTIEWLITKGYLKQIKKGKI